MKYLSLIISLIIVASLYFAFQKYLEHIYKPAPVGYYVGMKGDISGQEPENNHPEYLLK